jgi:hypothetical protein
LLSSVSVATATSLPAITPHAPSRAHAHPHDRTIAIATVALLLSGVFDVGRALYCRYRLGYAVTQSASLLSRRPPLAAGDDANALSSAAVELVRRLSGLRDLPISAVRAQREGPALLADGSTAPLRVKVTARYTVPLLSPHLRALFDDGAISIDAVGVLATGSARPSASALRSAV